MMKKIIILLMSSTLMQAALFSPVIEQAIELASQWHEQTYRRDRWRKPPFALPSQTEVKVPVVLHLTSVGFILQRAGWDDNTIAAGILHDILEDPNRFGEQLSYDQLEQAMGPSVAQLVRHVTERKKDEHGNKLSWKVRKEDYFNKIAKGTTQSMAISLADKIHNLWSLNQAIEEGVATFARATPQEQLWYYKNVLKISRKYIDPRLDQLRKDLEKLLRRFEKMIREKAK